MYIPYMPDEPLCAFTAMAACELADPVPLEQRASVPMITPDGVSPFRADWLDRLLPKLLAPIVGASSISLYSWHSMRIFRACSLLAAGASVPTIQALCRWQTEESLAIYARLNPAAHSYWLQRSLRADVSSVTTASIDTIVLSNEDVDRSILREVESVTAVG